VANSKPSDVQWQNCTSWDSVLVSDEKYLGFDGSDSGDSDIEELKRELEVMCLE
jgi:hypothetical protein